MIVKFSHSQRAAQGIKTFWFKPEKPLRYTAGQFIEMFLPHKNEDERSHKRWFTLSSSPTEELISITTRINPENSSFKKTLKRLKSGAEVRIIEPMGDFVLPKDPKIPLVFVAGGIGATPFRSMVKYLSDKRQKRDISLLYSGRHTNEVIAEELFENYLGKKFKISTKRLDTEGILKFIGNPSAKRIYLSGPEPMVEQLNKELLEKGINPEQLQGDYFPGYAKF